MDKKLKEKEKRKIKYVKVIEWLMCGMTVNDVVTLCNYHKIDISRNTIYKLRREYIDGEVRYDENGKRIM